MPSFIPQFVARAGRASAWIDLHHRFLDAHHRGDMETINQLIDEKYELEQQARGPAPTTSAHARRRTMAPAPAPNTTMTPSAVAEARARHGLLRRPPGRQPVAEWKLPRRN